MFVESEARNVHCLNCSCHTKDCVCAILSWSGQGKVRTTMINSSPLPTQTRCCQSRYSIRCKIKQDNFTTNPLHLQSLSQSLTFAVPSLLKVTYSLQVAFHEDLLANCNSSDQNSPFAILMRLVSNLLSIEKQKKLKMY